MPKSKKNFRNPSNNHDAQYILPDGDCLIDIFQNMRERANWRPADKEVIRFLKELDGQFLAYIMSNDDQIKGELASECAELFVCFMDCYPEKHPIWDRILVIFPDLPVIFQIDHLFLLLTTKKGKQCVAIVNYCKDM